MKRLLCLAISATQAACSSAESHRASVRDDTADRVTFGTVQREIRAGMSTADVVTILGAPNIVTTDEMRREQWVYDKISTEAVYSSSNGGLGGLGFGGGLAGPGLLGGALVAATNGPPAHTRLRNVR
jgi:hypothetical protein